MNRYFFHIAIVVTLLMLCLLGCQTDKPKVSDAQWTEISERLAQLDDSISQQNPSVLSIIERGLQHAPDSLAYYAYYERMASYYLLSATPDSIFPIIERTLSFCRRMSADEKAPLMQPRTTMLPRLKTIEGMALESKANYFQLFRQQMDTVIALRRKAYDVLRQGDAPSLIITLSGNMGDAYALNNQLAEAASWYRHAIFLADSSHINEETKVSLYMGLGQIYVNLRDFDSALHYYDMVGKSFESLPPYQQAIYLNNYGNYFYYRHDYSHAYEQFVRLKQLLERTGNTQSFDMYLCKINLADVSMNLGQTDQALQYIDEVEPFFAMYGVTDAVYYAHSIRMGLAARGVGEIDIEQLHDSEQGYPQPQQGLIDIRNKYLAEYYEMKGESAKALHIMKHQLQTYDSLTAMREHMLTREHMMRLNEDTLRLHQSLALEKERGATRAANMWVMLLFGLLIIVVLLGVVWAYHLRKRRMESDLRIIKLRFESIRQRISPHFILNVLTRYQPTAADGNEQQGLTQLAQLIRTNLEITHQPLVTLREELEFVSYYVHVECGNDVDFTILMRDSVAADRVLIPSMFIQILVENAIKHGLKGIEGQKTLTISVEQEQHRLFITVENNGRSFDIRTVSDHSTGTGLAVIRETIAIYNERHPHSVQMDFSMSLLSKGVGCRAVLTLPDELKQII